MNMQTLLNELKETGLNDYEIAQAVGAPQASIFRLRKGIHKSCSFERGMKIAQLHAEKCSHLSGCDAAQMGTEA